MVDSLTQFFENDTFTRSVSNETLQERISSWYQFFIIVIKCYDLFVQNFYLCIMFFFEQIWSAYLS